MSHFFFSFIRSVILVNVSSRKQIYSDFDDISLTATGGKGSHKIEADADAMGFKFSVLF